MTDTTRTTQNEPTLDRDALEALAWIESGMADNRVDYGPDAPKLTPEQLAEFKPMTEPRWPLIGVWRPLAFLAAVDSAIAIVLVIREPSLMVIAIAFIAFTAGATMIAALAFWARDRWLGQ